MQRRSMAVLGLGLAGALTLSACGGGGGDEESITFWDTSDSTSEAPVFRELIDKFTEETGIEVNYTNVPFSEANQKYKTAAQGGNAPDVLRADVGWTAEFASLGYLSDLTDTPATEDWDDFLEVTRATNEWEGQIVGVPQVTDTVALLYNKSLFEKAGVQPPTSWQQLTADAPKLKAAGASQGAIWLDLGGYYSLPFIFGEGADLIDVDAKKITVNSPAAVRGWQTGQDMMKAGVAAPNSDTANSYNNGLTAFGNGTVASIVMGPWMIASLLEAPQFSDPNNLGIVSVPAGSVTAGAPVGGHNYVIYKASEKQDAANQFVAFMSSADSEAFIAEELSLIPPRASAYDDERVSGNARVATFKTILDESGVPRPQVAAGGQLYDALNPEWPPALNGQKTPQAALDAVASQYANLLPDYTQ